MTSSFGVRVITLSVAATLLGCLPSQEDDGEPNNDAGSQVTYKKDVQPIFKQKCTPCHDAASPMGMQGGHNIASNYEDVHHKAESFDAQGCYSFDSDPPEFVTIGECSVISARRGWMPFQKACDMPTPPNPSVCVSSDELAVLEKWVAAGMPE